MCVAEVALLLDLMLQLWFCVCFTLMFSFLVLFVL